MSKNYKAIHYIQEQMKNFDANFVDCVIRCFNRIHKFEEPDGCLSNTVALYICAKEFKYEPTICYGLCIRDNIPFYHAWLEINEIIIDLSIYGNVNFSPLSVWHKIDIPYIDTYEKSNMVYGKFIFDENWNKANISQAEGWFINEYINKAPNNFIWKSICNFLNKSPNENLIKHLKTHIENIKIERTI